MPVAQAPRTISQVWVNPKSLITRPPFSDLLDIEPAVYEAVRWEMKDRGFDNSKGIDVWRGENVVVDGHTRLRAALELGIPEVAIFYHDFKDEDEAFYYAVKNQRNRRNIKDKDDYRLTLLVDQRKAKGGDRKSQGFQKSIAGGQAIDPEPQRSSVITASIVGTSRDKVEKIRTIAEHATPEVKEAVAVGKMRINRAYTETKKKREKKPRLPVAENPYARPRDPETAPAVEPVQAPAPPPPSAPDPDPGPIAPFGVNPGRFADDARLYAGTAAIVADLRAAMIEILGVRSTEHMNPYHRAMFALVNAPRPALWERCARCGGSGVCSGICGKCRGCGYSIPNL
jgi:hypothetical protein